MAASSKSIAVFLTILLVVCATSPQAAQAQEQPPNPEDVLKNFVIEGSLPEKPLPKIGVLPSLASDIEDVTVNAVVPGAIDTVRGPAAGVLPPGLAEGIPLGRRGRTEEIAAMVQHLVGPLGGYITGQCIHINGGIFLGH